MSDLNKYDYLKILIVTSIYLITAYFSTGFHHPDEHYQIIHWANYKLGHVDAHEMPWEHGANIRSGLQPFICFWLFKFLNALGIHSPFNMALFLRTLSSIYALAATFFLIKNLKFLSLSRLNFGNILLLYLLWFLPYIAARFSSESWAGSTFLFALGLAIRPYKERAPTDILIGCLMCLTFLFRFQCIFMVLGLFLWLLIVRKITISSAIKICSSGLVLLFLSIFIDKWMYGNWTFSPYNYFKANIIEDIASNYGTAPWYEIITYIIRDSGIPIGLVISFSIITLFLTDKKSPLLWCSIPFLIIHSIIPHKELRFLFPLVGLIPPLLISTIGFWKVNVAVNKAGAIFLYFCLALNFAALASVITRSTRGGENDVARLIYELPRNQKVNLITSISSNPYEPYMKYDYNFYKRPNIMVSEITSIWAFGFESKIVPDAENFLLLSNREIIGEQTLIKLKTIGAQKINVEPGFRIHFLEYFYDNNLHERELNLFYLKKD